MKTNLTNEELNRVNDLTNLAMEHVCSGGRELGLRAILKACEVSADGIVSVLELKLVMASAKFDTRLVGVIGGMIGRLRSPLYL